MQRWLSTVLVLLACAHAWTRSAALPGFEVVPITVLNEGKGVIGASCLQRARLQPEATHACADVHGQLVEASAGESFLDRMLGTNCFSQALQTVNGECMRLSTDARYRLAIELLNCHQRQVGGRHYPCGPRQTTQECTARMTDRDHGALTDFLTNVQRCAHCAAKACRRIVHMLTHQHACSMCLFVKNQDFQRHTEHLINSLHDSTAQAASTLSAVSSALSKQRLQTEAMAGRIEDLSGAQAQLGAGIDSGLAQLGVLQNASQQLDTSLSLTLQRTVHALHHAQLPQASACCGSQVCDVQTRVLEGQAELADQVAQQSEAHIVHSRQTHADLEVRKAAAACCTACQESSLLTLHGMQVLQEEADALRGKLHAMQEMHHNMTQSLR